MTTPDRRVDDDGARAVAHAVMCSDHGGAHHLDPCVPPTAVQEES